MNQTRDNESSVFKRQVTKESKLEVSEYPYAPKQPGGGEGIDEITSVTVCVTTQCMKTRRWLGQETAEDVDLVLQAMNRGGCL